MNNLQLHIVNYLSHCEHQKRLDSKTLKATELIWDNSLKVQESQIQLMYLLIFWKYTSLLFMRNTNQKQSKEKSHH